MPSALRGRCRRNARFAVTDEVEGNSRSQLRRIVQPKGSTSSVPTGQLPLKGKPCRLGFVRANRPRDELIEKSTLPRAFFLARPAGFEPATYRFVAGHSIR